jgi:hypothetical protein
MNIGDLADHWRFANRPDGQGNSTDTILSIRLSPDNVQCHQDVGIRRFFCPVATASGQETAGHRKNPAI